MNAGNANRSSLAVQAAVEGRANRHHTAAGTFARFEDGDRSARFPQHISRAQPGETRADDHDGISAIRRALGGERSRRRSRPRNGSQLEKTSATEVSRHLKT